MENTVQEGGMVMGIIKARKLGFQYVKYDEDGNVEETSQAVDHVDLDVKEGDFVAILGHNGSGKSTLAKHMNALLIPSEGTLWVDSQDTAKEPELWKIRQKAGMVFQNPDNQIIGTVVEEDVGFGPENMGVPTEDIWQRVDDSLRKVGMLAYRHHSPNKLSGGQKQRVAIARALATNPKVLLCDEATSALDPTTTSSILSLLKEINRTMGVTIVVITHEMKVIEEICSRVAIIDQSHIVEEGRVEEIFVKPKTQIAKQLIFPDGKKEYRFGQNERSLRIVFDGMSSYEPVISGMVLECGYPVNIMFADTKDIDGKAFGHMIIELPDDEKAVKRMYSYLTAHHIRYEEEN